VWLQDRCGWLGPSSLSCWDRGQLIFGPWILGPVTYDSDVWWGEERASALDRAYPRDIVWVNMYQCCFSSVEIFSFGLPFYCCVEMLNSDGTRHKMGWWNQLSYIVQGNEFILSRRRKFVAQSRLQHIRGLLSGEHGSEIECIFPGARPQHGEKNTTTSPKRRWNKTHSKLTLSCDLDSNEWSYWRPKPQTHDNQSRVQWLIDLQPGNRTFEQMQSKNNEKSMTIVSGKRMLQRHHSQWKSRMSRIKQIFCITNRE
jgi:hypothetical protein